MICTRASKSALDKREDKAIEFNLTHPTTRGKSQQPMIKEEGYITHL
jgi:hypothetical protein